MAEFQYLYHFRFDGGEIFEVKNLSLPSTAPKNERLKWYLVLDGQKSELKFQSMGSDYRVFDHHGAKVYLDLGLLVLLIGDQKFTIEKC